ncbi:MAG TPA: efflux RND transporter periplasmic adaptor subunit, partial [Nannocystaceae bacterium]|nr:efflux RND transporter periplasmic adaptor subunit [Nannocystaceae bacterium]
MASQQALTAAQHDLQVNEAARSEAAAALKLLLAGSRPEEIAVAEAQLERARAELVYIEQQLTDMVVIRAPIDGVVLTSRFRERLHEHVDAGGLVCEIANLATVRAEIFVPERETDSLAVGRPVTVKVESYPTQPFDGKVDFIAPSVERSNRTNTVRIGVALDNRAGRLKQDMHGY